MQGEVAIRRGQPLILLAMVIAVWVVVRAGSALLFTPDTDKPAAPVLAQESGSMWGGLQEMLPATDGLKAAPLTFSRPQSGLVHSVKTRPASVAMAGGEAEPAPAPSRNESAQPVQLPEPLSASSAIPAKRGQTRAPARWSADGWVLARSGGVSGPLAAALPSYGRSQAGAVLRYRLKPGSRHDAQAYLRGSVALSGQRQQELGAGLSARPVPAIPLRIGAELRAGDGFTQGGAVMVRPAVLAITELPPLSLPIGLSAETYVQAGYVGGDFATLFADGQVRVERRVMAGRRAGIGIGIGAWGGAQKGAERLDIGPSVTMALQLARAPVRVAADYRLRVAGQAQPGSGPAITISSGF